MKKRLLLIVWALGIMSTARALTLEECLQLARENYPAIKQYDLILASKDYDLSNAGKAWFPKLSVEAGAYGFTDILNSNSMISQMGVDIENYMVSGNISIQQMVYDGGQTAAVKRVIKAKAEADARQTDVTLHNVKMRAQEIFFGILLIDEQLRQNDILQEDLNVSIKTVEEMIRGGIANQTDLETLQVELLNAHQQHDAYEASRTAYLRMLGTFIGKELSSDTPIEKPLMTAASSGDASLRPEMAFFSSQEDILKAQRRRLNSSLLPTVGFVGMGLLHTQVSDMVNKEMLLGGLSVSWNIGALYTRKNDLRKLDVGLRQNEVQRRTFLFQNRLQQEETDGTIAALRKQLESDNEIVRLREDIRSKADSKVAAGTESVNELVRDINAVSRARGQRAIHEVQLLKAVYELKNLNGN